MRIAGRLEFRRSIFGPIVNCFKIPTLLCHCTVGIISLLLLIPPNRHDTNVSVVEERLTQAIKAVFVVPVAQLFGVSWFVNGSGYVERFLPYTILCVPSVVDFWSSRVRGKSGKKFA